MLPLGDIVGAIKGLGEVGLDWMKFRTDTAEQRQEGEIVRKAADILDKMLRNPNRGRFRSTEKLAKAIDDHSAGYRVTVTLLKKIGARHNLGEADSWTRDEYWEERNGEWGLKKGVIAGAY